VAPPATTTVDALSDSEVDALLRELVTDEIDNG